VCVRASEREDLLHGDESEREDVKVPSSLSLCNESEREDLLQREREDLLHDSLLVASSPLHPDESFNQHLSTSFDLNVFLCETCCFDANVCLCVHVFNVDHASLCHACR